MSAAAFAKLMAENTVGQLRDMYNFMVGAGQIPAPVRGKETPVSKMNKKELAAGIAKAHEKAVVAATPTPAPTQTPMPTLAATPTNSAITATTATKSKAPTKADLVIKAKTLYENPRVKTSMPTLPKSSANKPEWGEWVAAAEKLLLTATPALKAAAADGKKGPTVVQLKAYLKAAKDAGHIGGNVSTGDKDHLLARWNELTAEQQAVIVTKMG